MELETNLADDLFIETLQLDTPEIATVYEAIAALGGLVVRGYMLRAVWLPQGFLPKNTLPPTEVWVRIGVVGAKEAARHPGVELSDLLGWQNSEPWPGGIGPDEAGVSVEGLDKSEYILARRVLRSWRARRAEGLDLVVAD